MNKKILTVRHTFENNIYKESVAFIPFEIIFYYYYKTYANSDEKNYFIVLNNCAEEINISEDEYKQVVKYFNGGQALNE